MECESQIFDYYKFSVSVSKDSSGSSADCFIYTKALLISYRYISVNKYMYIPIAASVVRSTGVIIAWRVRECVACFE